MNNNEPRRLKRDENAAQNRLHLVDFLLCFDLTKDSVFKKCTVILNRFRAEKGVKKY